MKDLYKLLRKLGKGKEKREKEKKVKEKPGPTLLERLCKENEVPYELLSKILFYDPPGLKEIYKSFKRAMEKAREAEEGKKLDATTEYRVAACLGLWEMCVGMDEPENFEQSFEKLEELTGEPYTAIPTNLEKVLKVAREFYQAKGILKA